MGLSFTLSWSIWFRIVMIKIFAIREKAVKLHYVFSRSNSFSRSEHNGSQSLPKKIESTSCINRKQGQLKLEISTSSKNLNMEDCSNELSKMDCCQNVEAEEYKPKQHSLCSTMLRTDLHDAAIKLQKCYKSYRTRRTLADCAIVAEELWWKAMDFASLKHSSITFFNDGKSETALSRWARARVKAAKVGKGLSKDRKAQELALQHWLEAIDPRHRYGHNLHLYYDVWLKSNSTQPFFYWLDIGQGKEVNLEKCPRYKLQQQCVEYLGPKERQAYEVIAKDGKLVYKLKGDAVNTSEDSKWIFVLSSSRALYVGKKKKGSFHHSSFLSGGATISSGRLVVEEGLLKATWPHSGHYRPTEESFREFLGFLKENNIAITDIQTSPAPEDDESSSLSQSNSEVVLNADDSAKLTELPGDLSEAEPEEISIDSSEENHIDNEMEVKVELSNHHHKWTSGAGPRIRCVRDYPADLQSKALEHVNLSPRSSPVNSNGPIPSPRPSSVMRSLSPKLVILPRDR